MHRNAYCSVCSIRELITQLARQRTFTTAVCVHAPTQQLLYVWPQVVLEAEIRKLKAARFFSVSMDEVTDNSGLQWLGVHVYYVDTVAWERKVIFVKLQQLGVSTTADVLTDTLIGVLTDTLCLTTDEIASKLVNFSCDGAAVLQGEKTGVKTQVGVTHTAQCSLHARAQRECNCTTVIHACSTSVSTQHASAAVLYGMRLHSGK